MKIIHGNAQAEVAQLRHHLRNFKHFHWNKLTNAWLYAEQPARKCSLKQLWAMWRDVEAKRKAFRAAKIAPIHPRAAGRTLGK